MVNADGIVKSGVVGVRSIDGDEAAMLDDKFHIGSLTKAMTATMLARLIEAEKLSWNTTVADAFPGLAEELHVAYREVTLRQLLSHRAGLPDDRRDIRLIMRLRSLTGTPTQQRRELVKIVLSREPAHEPGTRMVYSNSGYAVAGAMAEAVTGESWEVLMQRLLFSPLEMTSAGFGAPGSTESLDEPRGHRVNFGRMVSIPPGPLADNPVALSPGGRVHCSVRDLARFMQAHLVGAQHDSDMLSKETFAVLHGDPESDGYAMGWGVSNEEWAGGRVYSHAGSNTMWFAVMRFAPERGHGFVAVTNQGTDDGQHACLEVIDKLIARHVSGDEDDTAHDGR